MPRLIARSPPATRMRPTPSGSAPSAPHPEISVERVAEDVVASVAYMQHFRPMGRGTCSACSTSRQGSQTQRAGPQPRSFVASNDAIPLERHVVIGRPVVGRLRRAVVSAAAATVSPALEHLHLARHDFRPISLLSVLLVLVGILNQPSSFRWFSTRSRR
jgi:hypothetical protein